MGRGGGVRRGCAVLAICWFLDRSVVLSAGSVRQEAACLVQGLAQGVGELGAVGRGLGEDASADDADAGQVGDSVGLEGRPGVGGGIMGETTDRVMDGKEGPELLAGPFGCVSAVSRMVRDGSSARRRPADLPPLPVERHQLLGRVGPVVGERGAQMDDVVAGGVADHAEDDVCRWRPALLFALAARPPLHARSAVLTRPTRGQDGLCQRPPPRHPPDGSF